MDDSCDILIAGGGIAGLTAAAAFGQAGFQVICVDPAPPITQSEAPGADRRTTAFLQPARALLDRIGLWDRLAAHASPLDIMRIVDAGGDTATPRIIRDFEAAELSDQPFGWNLPNWLLRREMTARLEDLPAVTFRPGESAQRLFTRETGAKVTLGNGDVIDAKLVIAADGRRSTMRAAAGIGVRTYRYGQKALAFAVTHPEPHRNISTEIHRSGGPFTLVPLPDLDGRPSSAVVWMERGPRALELMALDVPDFEAAMGDRSCGILGPLTLASERSIWPIISQVADRLTGERLALMAEAAHVVPPIGAQGLNMSLADLACLLDLATARPEELGGRKMLDAYARARTGDIRARVQGIDLLNRASIAAPALLRDARAAGIAGLYAAPPVRRILMQMGLGLRRTG